MRIINLTQHPATPEQLEAGVIDTSREDKIELGRMLTFSSLPSRQDVATRAEYLARLAVQYDAPYAMIGGAPWLMSALEAALFARRITPLYAFSVRESVETAMPDGSVQKVNVFRHAGFVPA